MISLLKIMITFKVISINPASRHKTSSGATGKMIASVKKTIKALLIFGIADVFVIGFFRESVKQRQLLNRQTR